MFVAVMALLEDQERKETSHQPRLCQGPILCTVVTKDRNRMIVNLTC
jgi:hypothetical protein